MRGLRTELLLMLFFVTSSAQAGSLTLGCSGIFTSTEVPKVGVAGNAQKENLEDFSIVVDLKERTVSGFWQDPIPFSAVNANNVKFAQHLSTPQPDKSIDGTVDRITGKTEATETVLYPNGNVTVLTWDLYCRSVKALF